jgi:hypothetical protein
MVALLVDLKSWDIEIEASEFLAQRLALCCHKEPMQLLFKRLEVYDGFLGFSTLTQKILELIHGIGITGQEVMTLQCLHRGSPLG